MSANLERIRTRAALHAAPDTWVTAAEVAAVMGRSEADVAAARPANHRSPGRARHLVARWCDWMEVLGYGHDDDAEAGAGQARTDPRRRDAEARDPERPVVLQDRAGGARHVPALAGLPETDTLAWALWECWRAMEDR